MTKVTYEQVLFFRQNARSYIDRHSGKFSKFLYRLQKMLEKTKKLEESYNEKVKEINIDLCEKDKDGFFVYEKFGKDNSEERYKFKPDNELKRDRKIRELLKEEVEIEPYTYNEYMDIIPKGIDFSWWEALSPFILPPMTEEIEQELYKRSEEKK